MASALRARRTHTAMLEDIVELHKQGRLEEAEQRCREQLTFNPDDPETLHLLAVIRRQRNDFAEAYTLVQRAIDLSPQRHPYYMTIAALEFQAQQWNAARANFETALRLNPNLTGAYSALGQIAMIQNDPMRAEENFKRALRADEERVDVLNGYGSLLLARGEADQAIKYFTRAAELNPGDASAQVNLGRAYVRKRLFAFAEQALSNALALRPNFHVARLVLAEAQLAQQKRNEAQETLKQLLAIDDMRAPALAVLGDAARANDDLNEAITRYRDSLEFNPRQPRVVEALAWCFARRRMLPEAIGAYRKYLELVPEDHDARRALGTLCAEFGLHAEALDALRAVLAARVDDHATRVALAAVMEISGDVDGAEREAHTVLRARPSDAGAHLILARAELRGRQARAARKRLDELDGAALNQAQRRVRLALRGLASDQLDDSPAAVRDWLAVQSESAAARALPALSSLPDTLAGAVARARGAGADGAFAQPVALLLGAPGSGVEQVAALAAALPGAQLLADRLGGAVRGDGFQEAEGRYADLSADEARVQARRYARAVERMLAPDTRVVIDWIPNWDARLLPLALRVLGQARLIVVGREPRDALINWLAFGCAAGYRGDSPHAAAQYLALARAHLEATLACAALPALRVDGDEALTDPTATANKLAEFLGLAAPDATVVARVRRSGVGGLPLALPRGRGLAYAEALAAPYAVLQSG
jgi:Tfp pilus assembly protein PilF